ncbi:MAG: DUF86 domain-containing protein [Deltaproteobacteria bacterium]|nr:DUF86 domain-containing protein [Deltaproteobacteria bacterium]
MTPTGIRTAVVTEKASWVREMIEGIRGLPLDSYDDFLSDPRNAAAAESYLRRGLEGLLDMGRHVLAKGFGIAVTAYKDVAEQLTRQGVISPEDGRVLRLMAGYRNRLVHFYHEISLVELHDICSRELADMERICDAVLKWLRENPHRMDPSI